MYKRVIGEFLKRSANRFFWCVHQAVCLINETVEYLGDLFLEGFSFRRTKIKVLDLPADCRYHQVTPFADGQEAETDIVRGAVVKLDFFFMGRKRMDFIAAKNDCRQEQGHPGDQQKALETRSLHGLSCW